MGINEDSSGDSFGILSFIKSERKKRKVKNNNNKRRRNKKRKRDVFNKEYKINTSDLNNGDTKNNIKTPPKKKRKTYRDYVNKDMSFDEIRGESILSDDHYNYNTKGASFDEIPGEDILSGECGEDDNDNKGANLNNILNNDRDNYTKKEMKFDEISGEDILSNSGYTYDAKGMSFDEISGEDILNNEIISSEISNSEVLNENDIYGSSNCNNENNRNYRRNTGKIVEYLSNNCSSSSSLSSQHSLIREDDAVHSNRKKNNTISSIFNEDNNNSVSSKLFSDISESEIFGNSEDAFSNSNSGKRKNKKYKGKNPLKSGNEIKKYESNSAGDGEKVADNSENEWETCISPDKQKFVDELLPPGGYTEYDLCIGCTSGPLNMTSQCYEPWNKIVELFKDGMISSNIKTLCKQIEKAYENNIRIPSNQFVPKGKDPLPAWPAGMIYEHFTNHIHEPTIRDVLLSRKITDAIDNIIDTQLYECKKSDPDIKRVKCLARGGKSKTNSDPIKALNTMINLREKILNSKSSNKLGAQDTISGFSTQNAIINTNRSWYVKNTPNAMYSIRNQ